MPGDSTSVGHPHGARSFYASLLGHMTPHPRLQLAYSRPQHAPEHRLHSEDELFRRFAPHVARIGYRLLGREDEVDDLVQDVFMAAFRQRGQLRDPWAIKGWLSTIAIRTARRRLRVRRLRGFVALDTPQVLAIPHRGASPEDETVLQRVYALLNRVGVEQRLAWTLRYIEGEQLERVAKRCSCSLATAKRRIAAAHMFLRSELSNG